MERSRRRGGLLVVVVVVGAAVVGWTIAGPGWGDGDSGVPEDAMSEIRERTADDTSPTTIAEHNANHAFAGAAQRLVEAGSFAFSGHVATTDPPSDPSPGRSVVGEVRVPNRSRQVSASGPGEPVIETVVVGPTIWERRAGTRSVLADVAFAFAGDIVAPSLDLRGRGGVALLPDWLRRTTDRRYLGTDRASGDRVFRASLSAEYLGPFRFGEPGAGDGTGTDTGDGTDSDAEVAVDLRVDTGGNPIRVKVGVNPTVIDLAITRIGAPVAIEPPVGKLPGVTDAVSPAEVHAAGLAEPVELSRLPAGWMLTEIELLAGRADGGCATLSLTYALIDSPDWVTFELTIMPATCAGEIVDRSLTAGEFSGERYLGAGASGLLTNGRTAVGFDSSLSMDQTLTLLESLEPYDPSTRPTPL